MCRFKGIKKELSDLWLEYRSEAVFGAVLASLMVFSYWAAAFIPVDFFEIFINPVQYVALIVISFYGAYVMLRHHEDNILRLSWGRMLLIWGVMEVVLLILRYSMHITAIGGTPDDPLYNASLTVGNIIAWLLFIYPSQVLRPGWLTWTKAFWAVSPMVIVGIIDYFVPANLIWLIMLYPAAIFLMLCWHVRKYRQWCENNFSSMDKIDAQWVVRYLIILALLGVSFYFISFWFVPNRIFTQQWMLFFILAYSTEQILFRKDPWAELMSADEQEVEPDLCPNTEQQPHPSAEENQAVRLQLEQWMQTEKPFRNPDFRLQDLRHVLPTNRTYMSQFIKDQYGCSFYAFVNTYRLEEAKHLLTEDHEMKIADVAAKCGFSSSTVFSRAFSRNTGMTPREWLANNPT